MSKKQNPYMNMVYQSFLNQGLSTNQARALTAEVGRENDFNPKNLFGSHGDAANGQTNLGFFSWQGTRRDSLIKHLQNKGLIDKSGNIERSQRSLDAMADFAIGEIRNNKLYEETKRKFLNNPNVDYNTAQRVLGKNFIRWDYDGKTLGNNVKNHHAKRDRYYNQLGGNANPNPTPAQQTAYSHNGLRLKSNEAVGGGAAHQGTYKLAHNLQNLIGGNLKYFTAFNDTYHHSEAYFKKKGNRNSGLHGAGLAMDIALNDPKQSAAAVAQIRNELNSKGLKEGVDYKIIDEYAKPSKGATGGHLDLRFMNTAAADRYHSGNGSAAPNQAPTHTATPSVNFDFQPAAPQLVAQDTNIQAAEPLAQTPQASNSIADTWGKALDTATNAFKQPEIKTDRSESWRIKPLDFGEPKPQTKPYEQQLAAAFGEVPDTSASLPDYIGSLVRTIYDNV